RLLILLDHDRVLAVLAGVVHRSPHPTLGFLEREAVPLLHQRSGRSGIVEPPMHRHGVAGLESAQADLWTIRHAENPTSSGPQPGATFSLPTGYTTRCTAVSRGRDRGR